MKTAFLAIPAIFGGFAVIALMLVSVVDASSRSFGAPILGAKEVSEVLMVICVGAALPVSVFKGRTISIEGLVTRFPPLLRRVVVSTGVVLSVGAMGLLAWRLVVASADARDFEETTALLSIPHHPLYLFLAASAAMTAVSFVIIAVSANSNET